MKVMLDTNIIIDIFAKRESFYENSYRVLQLGLEGEIETIMSAAAVKDIFYILKKYMPDSNEVREKVFVISNYIKICKTTAEDITSAIILYMSDFEDALIAAAARREKADYIITRNENDFKNSPVPAISPEEFLTKIPN
ncbi:MAG: PIN domain-containing protein [Treponema sp.]|nr:PIN domain-containing protein [Treponema sp.]